MREIKFRAWDEVRKKIYFPERLFCKKDGTVWHVDLGDTSRIIGQQGFELMQYTGLKDKNGTEIYESDVVYVTPLLVENNPSFRAIVEWGVSGFVIRRIFNFTDGFYMYPVIMDLNPMAFSFEVIGNIYEHPHLLGGEEE